MSVTPDDVKRMAKLSRLGVEESELPALVNELNGILQHMEELQSANLSGLDGDLDHLATPLRSDDFHADVLHRSVGDFAPSMRNGFFLVPRLTTHDSEGATSVGGSNSE